MDNRPPGVQPLSIRARLVLALALLTAFAGGGVLLWSADAQQEAAVEQAREFSEGVHQLTLAGLTAMMMTNTQEHRALFLDQIEQANGVRSLRVLRAPAVDAQYGLGTGSERPRDAAEHRVLADGKPVFEVRNDGERPFLKAVIPAFASTNFLGKNCMGCHAVPEGTVLGATTLEISLEKPQLAAAHFQKGLIQVAAVCFLAFALLAWFAVTRSVSEPLRNLARRLDDIAVGHVDALERLPVGGADEIADASAAFNRVMDKAAQMIKAERVASDVFANALEGIVVTDRNARILKVNPAFTATTGYAEDEVVGRTPALLQSGKHDQAFYEAFWKTLTAQGEWRGDIWNKRKNGQVYPEWLNISCVRDERGEIENYVGIFSDITERKRQEALITYQAHHDALTGLPNRTLFKDRLEQALALARRKGTMLGVMFLDLDRFKHINDTLGHDAGDELLKEVSRRLRASVREADTVARLGGDEFTVMLPELDAPAGAEAVARKILEATRQPYRLAGVDLNVTSSIGIALYPQHGTTGDTLMKNADVAMYLVKGDGRAGARLFDPDDAANEPAALEA